MNNIPAGDTSCYTNLSPGLSLQMYSNNITEDDDHHDHDLTIVPSSNNNNPSTISSSVLPESRHDHSSSSSSSTTSSLLYSLSILKDKVHQVQSLAAILLSPAATAAADQPTAAAVADSTSIAIASMNMYNAIQDIIFTASSLMLTFQQMGLIVTSPSGNSSNTTSTTNLEEWQRFMLKQSNNNNNNIFNNVSSSRPSIISDHHQQGFYSSTHEPVWYGSTTQENYNNSTSTTCTTNSMMINKDIHNYKYNNNQIIMSSSTHQGKDQRVVLEDKKCCEQGLLVSSNNNSNSNNNNNCDIIELEAADLLAKYTHYCQVCGKGFKRDANLRMHMRAHGDEYKTSAALSNPTKTMMMSNDVANLNGGGISTKKYSCPQEGCRWNKKHAKFQPLKSMICVKNHYKRSHCPKMYVCKRCNRKQFSVLSDLRTHEKHCGDLKWQCSCGTTFSRKDKLMGHVALFTGHTPLLMNNNIFNSSSSSNSVTTTINKNNYNVKPAAKVVVDHHHQIQRSQVPNKQVQMDSIVKMTE